MMQIPLGKKMTNFKCKPPENRLNLPGRGSVKQSSKMQAYRAYGAAHFYVQERCRHFRRGHLPQRGGFEGLGVPLHIVAL